MIRLFLFPAVFGPAVLGLAACGPAPTGDAAPSEATGGPDAAPSSSASASRGAGATGTAPPPPATTPAATTIPSAFRGTWDALDAPCDPVTDARLTIGENEAVFYESTGRVTQLTVDSPTRIAVTFAMSGEGENWTRAYVFDLSEGGTRLASRDPSGEEPGTFMRKKCA